MGISAEEKVSCLCMLATVNSDQHWSVLSNKMYSIYSVMHFSQSIQLF